MESLEEYEIQCFGFSVNQMQYELRELIKADLEILANKLVDSVITYVAPTMAAQIIENIPKFVEEQLQAQLPILNELDQLIHKSFHIPANVVLPEDIPMVKGCIDSQTEKELEEILDNLMIQFQQNMQLKNMLEEEILLHKKLLPVVLSEASVAEVVGESLTDECVNLNPCQIVVTKCQKIFEKLDI